MRLAALSKSKRAATSGISELYGERNSSGLSRIAIGLRSPTETVSATTIPAVGGAPASNHL